MSSSKDERFDDRGTHGAECETGHGDGGISELDGAVKTQPVQGDDAAERGIRALQGSGHGL